MLLHIKHLEVSDLAVININSNINVIIRSSGDWKNIKALGTGVTHTCLCCCYP